MSQPNHWPQVNDDDPQVARWRQAVQERMDAGFKAVLDELAEVKSGLRERERRTERCVKSIMEAWARSLEAIEKLGDNGGLKWITLLAAIVVIAVGGGGLALSWGDLSITKDGGPIEQVEDMAEDLLPLGD